MCALEAPLLPSRDYSGRVEFCLDSRPSLSCGAARRSCVDQYVTRHHSPLFVAGPRCSASALLAGARIHRAATQHADHGSLQANVPCSG